MLLGADIVHQRWISRRGCWLLLDLRWDRVRGRYGFVIEYSAEGHDATGGKGCASPVYVEDVVDDVKRSDDKLMCTAVGSKRRR